MRKNARQMVELVCEGCGKTFQRYAKEHKRNEKLGRKIFCSRVCNGTYQPQRHHPNFHGDISRIGDKRWRWEVNELTPFVWYLNRTRQRKQFENNLTLEYLKCVWDKQSGICPYFHLPMVLEPRSSGRSKVTLLHASLDRIDSSKGYVEGNVEFVSMGVNFMKNKFSREEVLDVLQKFKSS